jgi:transcription initiation factor TFIIB
VVNALDLPESIQERACVLFESAQDEGLLQGRSIEGFAAAAVYATCRTASVSRTVGEIVEAARADRDELGVAYDALNRDLGLPTGPIDPREYLARFASELDLPPVVERRARELAERAREEGFDNGRNPGGVAAACLYTAAEGTDHAVTQRAAANVADVTPVTLRTTYEKLSE